MPRSTVLSEDGPSHQRQFRIECRLDDGSVSAGEGHSTKTAEQEAARATLSRLRHERP